MLLREQDVARSRLYRHRLRQSIPASILLVPHFYALTRLHKIKINLHVENSFGAASRIRNEDSRLLTNRNLKKLLYSSPNLPLSWLSRIRLRTHLRRSPLRPLATRRRLPQRNQSSPASPRCISRADLRKLLFGDRTAGRVRYSRETLLPNSNT